MTTPPCTACDHTGIGLPGCPTCDPRTKSEGGPRCDGCGKAPCACVLDLDAVEARCNAAYHREFRFPRGDGTFGVIRPRVCCVSHAAIERDVGALVREVRRLREALADAIWRVEDGIGHKGAYLAEKYGDAEAVARYRAMLPAGALAGAEVGP